MIASEPLASFRRRPARVPARDASDARHARRRAHARRSARGSSAATASTARRTRSPAISAASTRSTRTRLTPIERLEHRMLTRASAARACSSSRTVRTWERNPQFYADILASSLAGQALFTHAPAPERARRVLSKLRQTPRLIQAARDNIKDPPGIFVKVGIETMRGALKFIDDDLPRAFAERRRSASARRPRRRADRSVAGGRRLHRLPRERASRRRRARRSGSGATSSSRSSSSTKASRCRSTGCWRSPRASCTPTQEAFKSLAGR